MPPALSGPRKSYSPLPALPLPLKVCLCETLAPSEAKSRFCLVMFDTEPMKPSNTGRLIADILPNTAAFQWSRTEPPQALLDLGWQARTISLWSFSRHHMQANNVRCLRRHHPVSRHCLLCSTALTEARKMFRKSPYLDALPVISVDLSRVSAYRLREAHADGQYCTAEVAIALLDLAGDTRAAGALGSHFLLPRTLSCGKTVHKGSVTATEAESV